MDLLLYTGMYMRTTPETTQNRVNMTAPSPLVQLAQPVQLLATSQCSHQHVKAAARMLHAQWPRGGSVGDYCKRLLGDNEQYPSSKSGGSSSSSCDYTAQVAVSQQQLPCSYLLIRENDGVVVGHGRLTECFDGAGGSAAAATYVIAEPRGQGYGSQLMALVEQEAIKLGYHYIYLWTATAIPFYQKIGYSQTERVSLFSACLKTLECDQVSKLEAMLAKRAVGHHHPAAHKKHETVMLPPDAATDADVWLRKRLVESVASVKVPLGQRREEILAAIQNYHPQAWEYCLQHVPWQQQVGPSCGLAALRMLRDHYVTTDNNSDTKMPSLLSEAQSKGYSVDGEIFDAHNLVKLADFCGLKTEMRSFQATSPSDILVVLKAGGTLILPYDSQPSTKRPCKNTGRTAHYGIVVGILFGYPAIDDSSPSPSLLEHTDRCCVDKAEALLLLVQQSLSQKLTIAPWSDFFESNQQLATMDESKFKLSDGAALNLLDCLVVCHGRAGQ